MLLRSRIASHLGPSADVTLIDTIPMIRTSPASSQVSPDQRVPPVRVLSTLVKIHRGGLSTRRMMPGAQEGDWWFPWLFNGMPRCPQDHIHCRILAQAAVDAAFAGV